MALMAPSAPHRSGRGGRLTLAMAMVGLACLLAACATTDAADPATVSELTAFALTSGVQLVLPGGAGLLQVGGADQSLASTNDVLLSTDDGETWWVLIAGGLLGTSSSFPARSSHWGAVYPDGDVIIGGGVHSGPTGTGAWIASALYTTWTQVAATGMPAAITNHASVVGSTLILTGGRDSDSGVFMDTTHYSTDKGQTWTQGASFATARMQHTTVALDDDRMMLAFGLDSGFNNLLDVQIYTVSTNSWATVTVSTPIGDTNPYVSNLALLPSGTLVYQGLDDLWMSKDEGVNWSEVPNMPDPIGYTGGTPMWTDSGLVFVTGSQPNVAAHRIGCADGSSPDADLLCPSAAPAMSDCTAAATTQILEIDITSSAAAITPSLVSGANSPGRTFTSAVVRVPTTGGDCDHDILSDITCNNDCACTLDISATDLAASCTVDASSGSFTATFMVAYEDAQNDVWGNAINPYTHTAQAATTIFSASQAITAAVGTATARVVDLQLISNVIAPAADDASDASMTISFKLVSATEVTSVAVGAASFVDGTDADTSDDLSGITAAADGAAVCGAATCSHPFTLTLTSLATICNFDGTATLPFAPTCSGSECDAAADAFTATISIAQPFNTKDICLPAAGAAAGLEQSLTATTSAALVTSASTAADLVWESFVHETGNTDNKQISELTSIKMGLYDASTDTCDANLATLQQVHDGTGITEVGTALESLTFDTPADDATHTVTMGLTLDNVGKLAELGVAGADESRKTAFQTNYRTLICTVVVRTVSGGFGSRRLTVTTASSSEVKAGAAGGEVVAFLPPSQAAGNYMVDSATTVAFRFTTGDADLLEEPAIREHIRNAVSASLAHAAGMSASQIVVTGMELVEGADGEHHVHVTTALVLRGSNAAIVAQHESATTNLAASSGLGDSIELKLSEAGVNNMQHASTTVSRDAPLPGTAPDANATTGNMNLFIIGGVGVAAIALIALVAIVAVRARGAGNAVTKIQPELPSTDVIVTTGHAASINGSNNSAWSDAA